MASDNQVSRSEISDPASEINGRIFLVEGKQFLIDEQALNMIVELSEFFRALLTSDFKESNQKEIELKEVCIEDFESFLTLVRIVMYSRNDYKSDPNAKEQYVEWTTWLNQCDIGALILLADRFDAPKAIDALMLLLGRMIQLLPNADLIDILEVAFQINHDFLKKLAILLMVKISKDVKEVRSETNDPSDFEDRMRRFIQYGLFTSNRFFLYNEDRLNALPLEIRKYICEQRPSLKGLVKEE